MVSATVQTTARGLRVTCSPRPVAARTSMAVHPMWQRGVAQEARQAVVRESVRPSNFFQKRQPLAGGLARSVQHSSALRRSHGASSSTASFHTSAPAAHGGIERPEPGKGIKITFRDSKGKDVKTVEANEGDDLLSIAHEYDIDLEGACEGSIACSTCHVILEPDVYDKLEEPGDDENDMLDLAFGLTDTSRLGCQVKVTRDIDGMVAQLPSATRNMYVDGAKGGH